MSLCAQVYNEALRDLLAAPKAPALGDLNTIRHDASGSLGFQVPGGFMVDSPRQQPEAVCAGGQCSAGSRAKRSLLLHCSMLRAQAEHAGIMHAAFCRGM